MGKNNTEQLKILEKYLGQGGAVFRKYCGMSFGAYCNACVSFIFKEGDNKDLYCNGRKETYCPHSISWCYKNLASIPPYLALPSDVIYFDWNLNGEPNHVGFVRERKSCDEIYTIEGNTDEVNDKGKIVAHGVVAKRRRTTKYVQAIFRPHFKATYKLGTLTIDGLFGYNSIAMLQKALKIEVDGILGQGTVKALQRKCGVSADGLWGKSTSKAVQKMVGVKVDGLFGPDSVKALQRWINKNAETSLEDRIMQACIEQSVWMKNAAYEWESKPTIAKSKKKGTCVTYAACVLQRLGYLAPGEFIWHTGRGFGDGKVYGTTDKMKVTYMHNVPLKSLKGKLKKGVFVMFDDNKSGERGGGGHIAVATGGWKGNNAMVWDNVTARKGRKSRPYSGNRKVLAIVTLMK